MKKIAKKIWIRVTLTVLSSVTIAIIASWSCQDIRQNQFDHDLIAAIKRNDTGQALALLAAGADANARDVPQDARPLWKRLWDDFPWTRRRPIKNAPTALLVLLDPALFSTNDRPFLSGDILLVKTLLSKGARIDVRTHDGDTPLLLAVNDYYLQTVKLLLQSGANPNDRDIIGRSSLHFAAAEGYTEFMQLLLDRGAQIDARDADGETPLFDAIGAVNHQETARLLLDRGADIHIRNAYGQTVLHLAARGIDIDMIRLLLNRGADPHAKDKKGRTPLDIARSCHAAKDVVIMLKQAEAKHR